MSGVSGVERGSLGISDAVLALAPVRGGERPTNMLHDARLDLIERQTNRCEFARWRERLLPGRWYHSCVVSISSTCYSGNDEAKFRKTFHVVVFVPS